MTGYGNAVVAYKDKKIHVEIKSLNSKQLDLISHWDRYLGMMTAMTQVPVPTTVSFLPCYYYPANPVCTHWATCPCDA